MRLLFRSLAIGRPLTIGLLVCTLGALGCSRTSGGAMGGSSGDSAGEGSGGQKQGGAKQKAGNEPESTQPQNSVSGQPSAVSDRGSADAVAHRSVAQPGAPQGTLPQDKNSQPAKPDHPSPAPER